MTEPMYINQEHIETKWEESLAELRKKLGEATAAGRSRYVIDKLSRQICMIEDALGRLRSKGMSNP